MLVREREGEISIQAWSAELRTAAGPPLIADHHYKQHNYHYKRPNHPNYHYKQPQPNHLYNPFLTHMKF